MLCVYIYIYIERERYRLQAAVLDDPDVVAVRRPDRRDLPHAQMCTSKGI